MMEDLLIVNAVIKQDTGIGDYVYRIEQPCIAMGKLPGVTVLTVCTISPSFESICMQADILILHLLTEPDLLPIVAERKKQGYVTIYEISDNFMDIHAGNMRRWFSDPANTSLAMQLIQLCDAAQAACDGILERYQFLNPNMMVFENQIAHMGALHDPKDNFITIGWGGSYGHKPDLEYASPVIHAICREHPFVKFSFMGDEGLYHEFFSSLPEPQKQYTAGGSLKKYLSFLDTLDIGIAPMLDKPFNHCRSDVKFLEYASRGVVPVLSSLTPYLKHAKQGSTALFFSDQSGLKNILSELVQNKTLRQEIAGNAHAYVQQSRLEELHTEERINFYRQFFHKIPPKNINMLELQSLSPDSSAYEIEKTLSEIVLQKGLLTESIGQHEEAQKFFHEAHRLLPDYYLPLFRLGNSYLRTGHMQALKYLDKALEINPRSLQTLLNKGHLLSQQAPQEAMQAYETALEIFPAYAPALEAIGLLFEKQGDLPQARDFYDAALKANPFYSTAASRLGRIFSTRGETDKAMMAFQVAADMTPLNLELQYECAACLLGAGNVQEASIYCLRALELDPSHKPARGLMEKIMHLTARDT